MSVIVHQAYENLPKKQVIKGDNTIGGWSFLQSLSETKGITVGNSKDDTDAYIHPIEKRSLPKLSEKSLEMCTESLGTENGSESVDELSFVALEATNFPIIRQQETNFPMKKPEIVNPKNGLYPPPINSNYSRMVKSYGEDGRVVVKAIRVCFRPRCFVSERSEGRLRLCLSKSSGDEEQEAEEDEDDEEKEEEEEEGIDGNNENLEGKIGNNKIRRHSRRCNENGNDSNWKQQQFLVTT